MATVTKSQLETKIANKGAISDLCTKFSCFLFRVCLEYYFDFIFCSHFVVTTTTIAPQELIQAENFDLSSIITPVKVQEYQQLLMDSDYDKDNTQYLVQGFKYGFSLRYQGPLLGNTRTAPNLKLNIGTKFDVWNKVMIL